MDTAQSTALTVQERATSALAKVDTDEKLRELVKQSTEIVAITNPAGYQQLHSARMVLKNKRIEIEKIAKNARDDATKFSKAVIEKEKELIGIIQPEEARLQTLQDEYDERVERERQAKIEAEQKRIAEIQSRINEIRQCANAFTALAGSVVIATHLEEVKAVAIDDTFAEFKGEAEAAKVTTVVRLTELREAALAHEADQRQIRADREELDRRRAEEDERLRKAAEAEAAATRKRAEEDAARLAELDRIARESRLRIEAEERAAAERIAEQERVARIAREAEERKAAEARAAQEKELRAREEKLAAERRQVEETQRKQREEAEAKARAAREAQEKAEAEAEARAKARAEQEAREAADREEQRKADELLGIRQLMVALCDRCSDTKEFAPVVKAINGYFAKHGDPRRGEEHREAA